MQLLTNLMSGLGLTQAAPVSTDRHVAVYIYKGKAYLPSTVKAVSGFYVEIEPVLAVPFDKATFAEAVVAQSRPVPVRPDPPRDAKPVLLAATKLRSRAQVEKQCLQYCLEYYEGVWTAQTYRRMAPRGTSPDPASAHMFDKDKPIEQVAEAFFDYIVETSRKA